MSDFDFDFRTEPPADPFASEDAAVGGSIDDLSKPDPDANKDFEDVWAEVRNNPLLTQIADICDSASFLGEVIRTYNIVEGEDPEAYKRYGITLELDGRQKQIVSLGINIVGVLFPWIAPQAATIYKDVVSKSTAEMPDPKIVATIIATAARRRLAAEVDMTLEEYDAGREKALDTEAGEWGE